MNIVIVGVGALGSQLVPLLRNAQATLHVIDFDHVEAKNVQSQFYAKGTVRKTKVLALAQTVDFLYGLKLVTYPVKLTTGNVAALLGNYDMTDLVVDCLDNGEGRRVIQSFVRQHAVPCLHGAVDADGTCGRVVWDEHFTIDDEDTTGAPTCQNGEHLAFLATVSAHMAYSVKEFQKRAARLNYQITPGGTIRM